MRLQNLDKQLSFGERVTSLLLKVADRSFCAAASLPDSLAASCLFHGGVRRGGGAVYFGPAQFIKADTHWRLLWDGCWHRRPEDARSFTDDTGIINTLSKWERRAGRRRRGGDVATAFQHISRCHLEARTCATLPLRRLGFEFKEAFSWSPKLTSGMFFMTKLLANERSCWKNNGL